MVILLSTEPHQTWKPRGLIREARVRERRRRIGFAIAVILVGGVTAALVGTVGGSGKPRVISTIPQTPSTFLQLARMGSEANFEATYRVIGLPNAGGYNASGTVVVAQRAATGKS